MNPIAQHRLHSQQLIGPQSQTAHDLVHYFGAVQGQEYAQTKWSLGLRLPHLLDADVEQQLTEGKILRTHLLRPTWHLVAAEDIRWLLQLTGPRVHQKNAGTYRTAGLDTAMFRRCNDLLFKTLEGGKHLTRDELAVVFLEKGIQTDGLRMIAMMMQAELEGIVCSGIRQGKQNTYALLEERVPPVPELSRDEALATLARRYFQARCPATVKDFATWSGLTQADCKRGIEICGANGDPLEMDKEGHFFFPKNFSIGHANDGPLHLLPLYDEYIMGYKDRAAIQQFSRGLGKPPAHFDNMIIYAGQIIGTWRRDIGKTTADVVLEFFQTPDEQQVALARQVVERFGKFYGVAATMHFFDPKSKDKLHRPGWAFQNS